MNLTLSGTLRRVDDGHFSYEGSITVQPLTGALRQFKVMGFVNDADGGCSFRLMNGERDMVIFEGTWTGEPVITHELQGALTLLADLVLVQCSEYGRSFAALMQGTDGTQPEYTYSFPYVIFPANPAYPSLLELCQTSPAAGAS